MKLAEIEGKIEALKKRYEELDAKSVNAGVFDGVVMSAMGVVDAELRRFYLLREKALVADVVGFEGEKPAPPTTKSNLPLPRDFTPGPGDEINPLDDLTEMPGGEAGVEVWGKLFSFMLARTTDYISTARESQKSVRPVMYTQGQHLAVLAMFAFVQTEYRTLSAYGRDRRNEVEKKLLARIEALEARPSLKYAGIWNDKSVYGEAAVVTDAGSMWHANRASVGERPGTSESWTLAVKRGANGKDAK